MEHRRHQLIERRIAAGHTQMSLASETGLSVSTVAAWERGSREPSPGHRGRLAEALGIDLDQLARLLVGAEQRPHDSVPEWLTSYDEMVRRTGEARQVSLSVVPGLLQTEEYAIAVEDKLRNRSAVEKAATVKVRIDRQEALYRTSERPIYLQALIASGVLWDAMGGSEVASVQMSYLAMASAEHPNIDVRILPQDGIGGAAVNSFTVLSSAETAEPVLAVSVDVAVAHYHEDQHAIAEFIDRYDQLLDGALTTEESIDRLNAMARFHAVSGADFETREAEEMARKLWGLYGYERDKR